MKIAEAAAGSCRANLASPALEALELLLDSSTPSPARLTMLAALSYLLMPADLIPDILPVADSVMTSSP